MLQVQDFTDETGFTNTLFRQTHKQAYTKSTHKDQQIYTHVEIYIRAKHTRRTITLEKISKN